MENPYQNGWFGGPPVFGNIHIYYWLVVEPTHLKNIRQIGSFPQGSEWKLKIFETTNQIISPKSLHVFGAPPDFAHVASPVAVAGPRMELIHVVYNMKK